MVILLSYFTSQNVGKRGKNQDLHHGTKQNIPYQTVLSKVEISNQFFQLSSDIKFYVPPNLAFVFVCTFSFWMQKPEPVKQVSYP